MDLEKVYYYDVIQCQKSNVAWLKVEKLWYKYTDSWCSL